MALDLPNFERGKPLLASDLNLIVSALIRRIVSGPGIQITSAGSQIIVGRTSEFPITRGKKRMRVQSNHGDYLICRTLGADGTIGTDDIYVLKPWGLRRVPFDGNVVNERSYVYSDDATRLVDGTETQQITWDYFAGAEIFVDEIDGSVEVTLEDDSTVFVKLVDANYDSRGWCEPDEDE